ncbi:MAG: 3-oxoacyl-ACP reductase [Proteobacteria bacterium]|nr:MAG: 3-oxoacyl-ACP reductase [Pseudomonadota bacterium]
MVLGASSGFGAAAARAFAAAGLDVAGVHLARRATLPQAEAVAKQVEAAGRRVRLWNANAADPAQRAAVVRELGELLRGGPRLRVLLHSLAFGTLRPLAAADAREAVSDAQLGMTLDVMAASLVGWARELRAADLLEPGARIFAMTSEGGTRAWRDYGPVAMAKAALEAAIRQLALELAPLEICANAICAGVTETPALRRIPGHDRLLETARARNPRGRLTTPEDVAGALVALAQPACGWISGNVIRVDGGEGIAG